MWEGLLPLAGPLAAAGVAVAVESAHDGPLWTGLVVFLALLVTRKVVDREPSWARVLPLMGGTVNAVRVVASAVVVGVLHVTGLLPLADGLSFALISGAAVLVEAAGRAVAHRRRQARPVRIAVIGCARVTASLDREIGLARLRDRYEVVGRILGADEAWAGEADDEEIPAIGRLGLVAEAVAGTDIDLLLMGAGVPRMAVFEEVSNTCLQLPVRVEEVASFYEQVFCRIASTEINAAWFQYVLDPRYTAGATRAERALDLVVVALVVPWALALLGVLALIVRRDGGPVLFRQTRIGEGGRPFTIYKLRTMKPDAGTSWASAVDDRVTRIGAILRRTHLDELPQVFNVLRNEMSIVGPRPEQLHIVEQLEQLVPYYQRRHLVKPGVTGWAQVRCGYAGSPMGAAWKVSHDLYYIKHRSVWLNLLIILETMRTLVADPQYTASPLSVDFITAPAYATPELFDPVP